MAAVRGSGVHHYSDVSEFSADGLNGFGLFFSSLGMMWIGWNYEHCISLVVDGIRRSRHDRTTLWGGAKQNILKTFICSRLECEKRKAVLWLNINRLVNCILNMVL